MESSGIANPIQEVLNALDVSICTSLQPPSTQAGIKAKELAKEKEALKVEGKELEDLAEMDNGSYQRYQRNQA